MKFNQKSIIIVAGLPRSNTTHFADTLSEYIQSKFNIESLIYDELDPTNFIDYENKNYDKHLKKSKLLRKPTSGELNDRFTKKSIMFLKNNLSLHQRFHNTFCINNKLAIFKFPRILESKKFRMLLMNLCESNDIYLFFLSRPNKSVMQSFIRRNMYFSKYLPFKYFVLLYIFTYKRIEKKLMKFIVPSNFIIDNYEMDSNLLKLDDVKSLEIQFRYFFIWRYYFKSLIIIRNYLFRRLYW